MKKKPKAARVGGRHPESVLQKARVKAGVSQEKAAEKLDCDVRTIQRYEAGKQSPNRDTLLKMKRLYSCEFADLFPEDLK